MLVPIQMGNPTSHKATTIPYIKSPNETILQPNKHPRSPQTYNYVTMHTDQRLRQGRTQQQTPKSAIMAKSPGE